MRQGGRRNSIHVANSWQRPRWRPHGSLNHSRPAALMNNSVAALPQDDSALSALARLRHGLPLGSLLCLFDCRGRFIGLTFRWSTKGIVASCRIKLCAPPFARRPAMSPKMRAATERRRRRMPPPRCPAPICIFSVPDRHPTNYPTRAADPEGTKHRAPLDLRSPESTPGAAIICRTRNTLPRINLKPSRFAHGLEKDSACPADPLPAFQRSSACYGAAAAAVSHGHRREIVAQWHVFRDVLLRDAPLYLVFSLLHSADIAIDDAGMVLLTDELVALRMLE